MDQIFKDLTALEPFHGVAAAVAVVLPLLLLVLLPRGDRRLACGPLWLMGAHLLCLGLENAAPANARVHLPFKYVALFFLLCSLGRSIFLLLVRTVPGQHFVRPLPRIFLDILQTVVYVAALLLTLGAAGVELTSLVTGSALVTAVIGLSMRDTLGNIFAGLAIQVQQPFQVGDWIAFDDHLYHIGKILEINWRATRMLTLDEVEVVVPNSELAQKPLRNFTKPERYSRRSIYVVAPYDVPPQRVQRIILEAISDAWGVLSQPAPSVVTNAFTDRGVEYWIRFFTIEFGSRDRVDGGVRDRIWSALQRQGITIPGPIRQVEFRDVGTDAKARENSQRMERRKAVLRRIDFLQHLPDDAIDRLANASQKRFYAAGETIIREGEPGSELFIIKSGEVRVKFRLRESQEEELGCIGPTQFFGEISCMTGEPRSATVIAITDCDLYVVDRSAFQPILEASPELAERISEVLARRLAEIDGRHARVEAHMVPDHSNRGGDLLTRIRSFFSLS